MNRYFAIKSSFLISILAFFNACTPAELQSVLSTVVGASGEITSSEAGMGLKEALSIGIGKGSDLLSQKDGYFKSIYKILLPEEARIITEKLQAIPGFAEVENVILEKINRGAEDAAQKAKPIFLEAIKNMTFSDAMNILLGDKNAATLYLQKNTREKLFQEFQPVIIESLDKFNARKYWTDAVNTYNKIPFIEKAVDPNLDTYVTNQALNGLFSMVEKEELNIRTNISARTTELLKKVFAKQDKS